MFKTYRVGTLYGIPFKLDVTFVLILPVFAGILGVQIGEIVPIMNGFFGTSIDAGAVTAGIRPFLIGFVAAVALFACVTVHELGHSVVAISYGYEVESITLWLLGGIAKPAELPRNWIHEFWIAVAGPLVNVAIVAGCGALLLVPGGDIFVFLVLYLAMLNAGLAAFNMLPAFPLDGGRVLRALLARDRPYLEATRVAATVGKGFALLLGVIGVAGLNFVLVAVALFVYVAATSETRQMMLDAAFEGLAIEDVMTPAGELETVPADSGVSELLDVMLEKRHSGYPVLDDREFVGIVTLEDLPEYDRGDTTVADAMTPADELETIRPDQEVMTAFRAISGGDIGRLPVVDGDGHLLGLITRTDLMRAFKIVTARQQFEGEDLDRRALDGGGSGRREHRGNRGSRSGPANDREATGELEESERDRTGSSFHR